MLQLNFEKYTLKKLSILFGISSIFILVLSSNKLGSLISYAIGTGIGALKLILLGQLFNSVIQSRTASKVRVLFYVLALMILYMLSICSFLLGLNFFVYFFAGILLLNFTVLTNGILEALGLTKNIPDA